MDQLLWLMTGLGPKVTVRDLQCKTRGQLPLACTACSVLWVIFPSMMLNISSAQERRLEGGPRPDDEDRRRPAEHGDCVLTDSSTC